ncbi:cytochrome P450 [Streptomyces malaysiensis]|uniref:Cytochrome P450 n=1 Tax=Streptomyces malaysiensis subsp. samsunensis TaxID=459658 RepID=A0A9X2RZ07_STRMQ|nr:cytochrome P450 [Streptomyces samsunensis]MCQ8835693.1 cytochrome P450 [Streptomyces samsunensis]
MSSSITPLLHPETARQCPFAPPAPYTERREEQPLSRIVLWDGSTPWLATRFDDVRRILKDSRFSADTSRPGYPFRSAGLRALTEGRRNFGQMDDPEHGRLRGMLAGEFTLSRMERLRPEIQRIVDGFIDQLADRTPPADLVSEFALPIPSLVICRLLGAPYSDRAFFQKHSMTLLDRSRNEGEVANAESELSRFLSELVDQKSSDPQDDLLSRLVAEREATGQLTRAEIVGIARLLLVAGHETTANMIALSALALLTHPEQLAAVRNDPALVKGSVEELLRYLSVAQTGLSRVAVEDIEWGDETIRAGEGIVCMLNTANRDPRQFTSPDDLDVRRDARSHVAFGFGVHHCLGHPLARLELQVALETLLRRLPNLRLAVSPDELSYRYEMAVFGVRELPVAW